MIIRILSLPPFASYPLNNPHFPLLYLETTTALCLRDTKKSLPRRLVTICVFGVLVSAANVCRTTCVKIRLVANVKVRSSSKVWSVTLMIIDCLSWLLQKELIIVSERKNKRLSRIVGWPLITLRIVPFQWCKSSNFLVIFTLNDCKGIGNSITFFMEFLDAKIIFGCSIK